jgi:type I restriction enzyme S subunit
MIDAANAQKKEALPVYNGFAPYSQYKDSGEPWLGKVPEHWALVRTKALLCERVTKGYPDEPLLAATQTKGVVRKEQYENRTVLALKDLHLLKLVRVGDFVISLRSFQGGIEYAREQGIISPAYTILYPKTAQNHAFLAWLFKSKPYIENLALHVTGIRQGQNIDYERLSRSALPLPPIEEQIAIARFLNYTDRQIKRYIRAKQKLVKLLNEEKQAIIQQAVIHGINPNVCFKPSVIEWLGDVPATWKIKKIKYLFQEVDKRSTTGNETLLSLRMYQGLVPHNEVSDRPISSNDVIGFKLTQPGEVVMNRMRAASGMFAVTPMPGIVSPDYAVFRQISNIDPDYYVHLFKTPIMRGIFRSHSKGLGTGQSGFLRLYSDKFCAIKVPVPPIEEQQKIVTYLNETLYKTNFAITNIEKELQLVEAYRNRLMSDIVTGQLDVRDIALRLPDEIDPEIIADELVDETDEIIPDIEDEGETDEN